MTVRDPAIPQEGVLAEGTEAVPAAEEFDMPEGASPLRAFCLYLTAGSDLACEQCRTSTGRRDAAYTESCYRNHVAARRQAFSP